MRAIALAIMLASAVLDAAVRSEPVPKDATTAIFTLAFLICLVMGW